MATNPFDYINAILENKKVLIVDDETEKGYVPFLTNRALSNHADTIMYAQEMNVNSHIDHKLQNDYLINSVRGIKRKFVPWSKKKDDGNIEAIKLYYGFNTAKAKTALRILSKEQLKIIKDRFAKVKANE